MIAGLCVADSCGALLPVWILPALLLITFLSCFVRSRFPFLVSHFLLFYAWGGLSLQPFLAPGPTLARYAGDSLVLIEGVVDERPQGTVAGGQLLFVQVEWLRRVNEEIAVDGRLLVQVKKGRAQLATGDRILFSSKIRVPRCYGLPGEVDYPRQLAYRKVFATAFVAEAGDLLLLRAGTGWRHEMDLLAKKLGRFMDREAPGSAAGVLKALLLGDRGDVPEEVSDAYALSGVNHILSISGFHIGIIFLSIFHLLFTMSRGSEFLALRFNLRKSILFAALPVAVFYLLLSGGAAATVRSVLMIAAVAAALQLKREVEPVNAVLLAACGILFLTPQALFDLSFQLSFLAIWGLVTLTPLFSALLLRVPARAPVCWLCLLLAASAAAMLATLVPVAYYFHQVSLVGLVANLVVIPVMGYGAVVAGFASLPLIEILPDVAGALIRLAAHLVRISDVAITFFARAPVLNGYLPGKLDFLLACLVLCALSFLKKRHLRYPVSLALVAILATRAVPAGAAGDNLLHVTFLSVGQGDATLVRLPDGRCMLVDGGGRAGDTGSRVGERLLLPALRSLGIRRIDYLVLSHEHPDHLQGVLFLAAHFDIGEFWESGVPSSLPEYLRLKWLLTARGIPVRTVNASLPSLEVGGAQVDPLWPAGAAPSGDAEANENSLVLRLRHGKSSVLLTGDIGTATERELMARGAPLKSTLLKVAHHGSKYSSSEPFLAAVSPEAAVISAGYGNPFHLPAETIVRRVQKRGIRLYRTDQDGTVEAVLTSDGSLTLSTPWGYFN